MSRKVTHCMHAWCRGIHRNHHSLVQCSQARPMHFCEKTGSWDQVGWGDLWLMYSSDLNWQSPCMMAVQVSRSQLTNYSWKLIESYRVHDHRHSYLHPSSSLVLLAPAWYTSLCRCGSSLLSWRCTSFFTSKTLAACSEWRHGDGEATACMRNIAPAWLTIEWTRILHAQGADTTCGLCLYATGNSWPVGRQCRHESSVPSSPSPLASTSRSWRSPAVLGQKYCTSVT